MKKKYNAIIMFSSIIFAKLSKNAIIIQKYYWRKYMPKEENKILFDKKIWTSERITDNKAQEIMCADWYDDLIKAINQGNDIEEFIE